MNVHDLSFKAIDGSPLPLGNWRGRPALVVNTASACGFTPQYAKLQTLWERYRERGLVVLGVPSNDFGAQEPGDEAAIRAFCDSRFGVSFPLSQKEPVIGPNAHPFYQWIADEFGEGVVPRWNFHKYLIDGEGNLVGAWPSKVDPLSEEVLGAIEGVLPKP